MKKLLLLIGMLLAFDVGAQSVFATGNKLAAHCGGTEQQLVTASTGFCIGYVSAVADVMAYTSISAFRACIPVESVSSGRLVRVTFKYLREHPEQLRHSAESVVARALSAAFPCKQ